MGVKVKGLDKLLVDINNLPKKIQAEVDYEMSQSATTIALRAAEKVPVDEGRLKGAIKEDISQPLTKYVTVNLDYAPFIEFGTKKKVQIPSGLESYAAQFKKKMPGTFELLVDRLTDWVRRKGIAGIYSTKTKKRLGNYLNKAIQDRQVARQIAIRIAKNGIKAQPFLFPAFFDEEPRLIKRLQDIV